MTNTNHLIHRTAALAAVLALVASGASAPRASATSSRRAASAYGWPVKPFDQPHPVRANFGDPRTTFHGPPSLRTLLTGPGSFSFHFGIDISAADGTAVYTTTARGRSSTRSPSGAIRRRRRSRRSSSGAASS